MIIGIVLAAGRASRFGQDKRLQLLPDESPMALATASRLREVVDRVHVAIRPEDQVLRALLESQELNALDCAGADQGMGSTLAEALVQSLAFEVSRPEGLIVSLADMPFIHPSTYRQVRDALVAGASIVRPAYQGQPGHPVGFSQAWLDALCQLKGERAAKELIDRHQDKLQILELADPGSVADIDRPQDLARWHSTPFEQVIM